MADYTPRAGDLIRDNDHHLWFVYADHARPDQLYALTTSHDNGSDGHPIQDVQDKWGPLRLEYRPA